MTHEEVIKQLENLQEHCFDMAKNRINDDDDPWAKDCKALEYAIKKLKKAKWICENIPLPLSDSVQIAYKCSNCGLHYNVTSNYCPNCGAEMENK